MPIPDYQSLMLPVLEIASKGETSVPQMEAEVAARFGLSEAERQEMLPSGRQRLLHNRIHWAKFYLAKAGLLESPKRGRFVSSAAGSQLLATHPAKIDTQYLLSIPAFREFYRNDQSDEAVDAVQHVPPSKATPEEVVEAAYNNAQAGLRAELLDRILQNNPSFFERVIVDLLVAMGYGGSHKNASEQLGRSGDGGVDGVINEDVLGLDRVYVQAKRYSPGSSVGRPDIQAFTGSLVGMGAMKGVFVTTSTFSAPAIEFASRIPQRIILIDGKRLTELMIEHSVGVRSSRILEFKRLDEDFFSEEL
jgi:restriction system protein